MTTPTREQVMENAKFHEERLTGIGASDAAAALGASQWATPYVIYQEKRGERPPFEGNALTHWGQLLEPVLVAETMKRYPTRQFPSPFRWCVKPDMMRSPKYPWMIAHLDAWIEGRCVVEAKTAGREIGWGEDGSHDAPTDYVIQVHHEMIVAEVDHAIIPVLIGGNDFRIIDVPYDKELGQMVIDGTHDLWMRIQKGDPPPLQNLADVEARYKRSTESIVYADEELASTVDLYRGLKKKLTLVEAEIELAEKEIKSRMEDADTLYWLGKPIATWRSQTQNRLDTKALKADFPEVYEALSREINFRTFRLKGEK